MLKYRHNSLNSCSFSSLESFFIIIKQNKAENYISLRIEESLNIKVGDSIDFANAVLNTRKNLGKQRVYYSLR